MLKKQKLCVWLGVFVALSVVLSASVVAADTVPGATYTDPPRVLGAHSLNRATVLVDFDKPLEPASAQNPANYAISRSGGGSLAVTGATLLGSGTAVALHTADQEAVEYTLTVTGVRSSFGVTIAGNNTATFSGLPTRVFIHVPNPRVGRGGTFEVHVMISSVRDLYGAAVNLSYAGPITLQAIRGQSPPLVGGQVVNRVNASAQTGEYAETKTGMVAGTDVLGDSVFATLVFAASSGTGNATINISAANLVDSHGLAIPTATASGAVEVVLGGRISGAVRLQYRSSGFSGVEVSVSDGVSTQVVTTAADGLFAFEGLSGGPYRIVARKLGFLASHVGSSFMVGPSSNIDAGSVQLLGGEVNGDDVIDIFDIVRIARAYNLPAASNPVLDVVPSDDAVIDLFDIVGAAINYGSSFTP